MPKPCRNNAGDSDNDRQIHWSVSKQTSRNLTFAEAAQAAKDGGESGDLEATDGDGR